METTANIPKRAAGVLLPVSSLPSPYGVGTFGSHARQWVDFLAGAGQTYWQVLPLGPTSYGDSPYNSVSAIAGNPFYIDLDTLYEEGLLRPEEYTARSWGTSDSSVDYDILAQNREPVLRKAFSRFEDYAALAAFHSANAAWLDDFALYTAIKAARGGRSWAEWEPEVRMREPAALESLRQELALDIRYHVFVQYLFFKQWHALRSYAAQKGVQIIGDIPICVSMDSADMWANRHLFQLEERSGLPVEVAGCPPDRFALDGQLWGNPLYNWDVMEQDGYAWWIARMRANFALYDVLRIDHFRGLESYYAIPYGDLNARRGRWRPGPGMKLLRAIKEAVPQARIMAEDLGFLTPAVHQLLEQSGYPGMKVLQFAFDTREPGDYSPYNYGVNNVVFTGTHDNDTVLGWAQNASDDDVSLAMAYTHVKNKGELPRAFIRLAMQSAPVLAMVPLQDWLGLGSEARINIPSTIGGNNWRWRMPKNALSQTLADDMMHMSGLYGRRP